MIHVRHRTASGRLDETWEYDPARKVVDVVLRLGSAEPLALTLPVCAVDRPRPGAYPIIRLDGSSWRVLPERYWLAEYIDAPIHESLGREQLVLTHAPADVDAELESL